MHEPAIAESLVEMVEEVAAGRRVFRIALEIARPEGAALYLKSLEMEEAA